MLHASRQRGLYCAMVAFLCVVLLGFPLPASAQSGVVSLIVKLVDGLPPELQADVIARNGGVERSVIPALRLHVIDVPATEREAIKANYQADPRVLSVEENRTRVWEATPVDPLYPYQWALPRIGWDQVFGSVTPKGTSKVALLDTGVDAFHPDLAGKVAPGTSLLDGSNGMTDPSGHGTWLAGIIAAQTDNVPVDGIAGVAYTGVTVMPVTVLNANGEGQDSDIIAGVIWAVDQGADVILMAFSNPGFSPSLQEAVDYAWSKGVVLVAAVGNAAMTGTTFPAGDRGVMGVAATDASDALAYFSNDGQAVFIAAPGVDIATTDIGDAYVTVNGTSASAAIVAGAAALMKAVDPTLTNGVIVGRLARNADAAGTQSQTGNGRINLPRALADTSTEFIQPAGAAPVGDGGPFVGPYQAAACSVSGVSVVSQSPSAATALPGQTISYTNITLTKSNGNCTGNWTINWIGGSAPSGTGTSFSPSTFTGSGTTKTTTLTITTSTSTPVGIRSFTVTAGGSDTDGSVTSGNFTFQLNKANTTTVVARTAGPNPSTSGQSLTFTATVTVTAPGTGTPTGSVTFKDGVNPLVCTGVGDGTLNGSAQATCTISTLTVSGSPHSITGTYNGDGNFNASPQSAGVSQTVNKANQTIIFDALVGKTYGDPAFTVSATGGASGNPVTFSASPSSVCASSGTNGSVIAIAGTGTCTVTASQAGDANYNAATDVPRTFAVSPAPLTVTADNKSREYGDANAPLTATFTGFKNGETLATSGVTGSPALATTATAGSPVSGSPYTITAAIGTLASGNYTFAFVNGQLTVTKATLTVAADNKSRAYGAANPSFTASYSGFKNGETLATSGVMGTPSLTTAATPTSSVSGSPYTITAGLGTLGAGNYGFAFVNGQLTITGATLTVTADSKSREYGEANPPFTATITGFQNGETLATSGVTGSPSLTTTATATSPVSGSPYPITAALGTLAAGNYQFTFFNGQLTLTTATLSVTADNATRPYGAANPTFTASYSGFKNGETLATSGVAGSPSLSTTATASSPVAGSPYTITAALGSLAATNYQFSFVNGQLTITKADPVVMTIGNTCTYNGGPCEGSGSAKGVFEEVLMPVTVAYATTPAPGNLLTSPPIAAGTYSVAARYAGDANYNAGQSAPATIKINKAAAAVTPDPKTKMYGGADPTLTGTLVGFVATDGITAAYSRTAGENVADSPYTISATLSPAAALVNYDVTYNTASFTITKADPVVTATGNTCPYNGGLCAGSGSATGVFGETLMPVTVAYATTPAPGNLLTSPPIAAGTYSVSARYAGDANYNGKQSAPATITINKAAASVTPNAASKTYGAADPTLTGTLSGFVPADGVTATYTRAAGETVAGSPYVISAVLSPAGVLGNYDITYNSASFSISPKTASVTPATASKTYGDPDPALTGTLSGFLASDAVFAAYSRTAGETVAGNPYTISAALSPVSALGNYAVTYNTASFTINKKAAYVTPTATGKTYGDADPTLMGTLSGFLAADGVTAAYSRTAGETVAGSPYTVTATLSPVTALGNYTVIYKTANFTIAKATLTVTADNKTKILNATNPPLTATTTGFKNGDTLATSGVTGSPLLSTTATTTSAVGSYPISASSGTLSAPNYAFAFTDGTLSIMYAPVGSVCYGDAGHQILQPINADGSSVFKQKSTVPAKFRVCDANGNSIGMPGVVTSFVRYYSSTGAASEVDELVDSTTPDTAFRWSSSDQQWIFNISTKSLSANMTYYYRITISDGSIIEFRYGLR